MTVTFEAGGVGDGGGVSPENLIVAEFGNSVYEIYQTYSSNTLRSKFSISPNGKMLRPMSISGGSAPKSMAARNKT